MFFHQFYQPKVQWLSGNVGYISVQALHSRLRVLDFVYLPFGHSRTLFLKTTFSLHSLTLGYQFRSTSSLPRQLQAFEKLWKKKPCPLQLVSFLNHKMSYHVWDLMFLHNNVIRNAFSYPNFQRSPMRHSYQLHSTTVFQKCLWSHRLINSQHVFYRSKITYFRVVILNPIKHCCSFIKHFLIFLLGPCGRPADIPHAKFEGRNFDYKDKLRYSCKKGFKLRGPKKRTCREDGNWSRPPSCTRKTSFLGRWNVKCNKP